MIKDIPSSMFLDKKKMIIKMLADLLKINVGDVEMNFSGKIDTVMNFDVNGDFHFQVDDLHIHNNLYKKFENNEELRMIIYHNCFYIILFLCITNEKKSVKIQ